MRGGADKQKSTLCHIFVEKMYVSVLYKVLDAWHQIKISQQNSNGRLTLTE